MQKLNPLSHPNATLAPQTRQVRASGENLNYVTLAPQAKPSGEIFNYSLSHLSDILGMIIGLGEVSCKNLSLAIIFNAAATKVK